MKHTNSEQELRVKLENIIEATVGWDQNLDWVKPETWNDCTNQIAELIQSEREKILKEISNDLSKIFSEHRNFETKENIRKDVAKYFIAKLAQKEEK